jgi:bacterial/archaeal transporter family-2 protein
MSGVTPVTRVQAASFDHRSACRASQDRRRMSWLLYAFAIAAGVLNTVQSGANVTLNKTLEQPILAALVVAAVGAVVYLLAAPIMGLAVPSPEKVAAVPWWGWLGGALGAIYVLCMILIAGQVGAAAFTGLTVTSAIVTSILLDHYGWLGFDVHAAGLWRLLGGGLMIVGLALVCLF